MSIDSQFPYPVHPPPPRFSDSLGHNAAFKFGAGIHYTVFTLDFEKR